MSLLAVPLCLLSTGLVLNLWVGYFPTVQTALNQLTAGPLPDQTDLATVNAMAARGAQPQHGSLVPVEIPEDGSHFCIAVNWSTSPRRGLTVLRRRGCRR